MPAMTAFSKAALDGGIEHDSVQTLHQVAFPSCGLMNLIALMLPALHLHKFSGECICTFSPRFVHIHNSLSQ